MDIRIPPLKIKILFESNPLKSRILERRLAVSPRFREAPWRVLPQAMSPVAGPAAGAVTRRVRYGPEGTKRATSVIVQLPCLQKDLRTGSISRDIVNSPSELCRWLYVQLVSIHQFIVCLPP